MNTCNSLVSSSNLHRVGIRNISDYSPFGVLLKERTVEVAFFRRGFQGQEHDDEVKGKGNSVNYTFRMHDPRVGRFFAVDPLISKYPHFSSYSFSGNRVIDRVELEGLEPSQTVHHAVKGAITLPDNARVIKTSEETVIQVHDYHGNLGVKTLSAGVVSGFYLPNSDGSETYYQAAWVGERFVGYYKTLTEEGLSTGLGPDGSNSMETAPYNSWQESENSFVQGATNLVGDEVVYGPQTENQVIEANAGSLAKETVIAGGVLLAGILYIGTYENLADYCSFDINFQWPTLEEITVSPSNSGLTLEANPTKAKDLEVGGVAPTPETAEGEFTRLPGDQGHRRDDTGEIYKKSHTSHGNEGNTGTQWKIWPKGERNFGKQGRTTVDGKGVKIGD